jgi:hypothetical protein
MLRDRPSTFRVSKILSAHALDGTARPPRNFDLAAYSSDSMKRFERELYTGEATLLATPAGLKGLGYLGTAVARAVAAAPAPRRKDVGLATQRMPVRDCGRSDPLPRRLLADSERAGVPM